VDAIAIYEPALALTYRAICSSVANQTPGCSTVSVVPGCGRACC